MEPSDQDTQPILDALVGLHRHLADEATIEDTLQRVAVAAHAAVHGCDTAAITFYDRAGYHTAAMAGDPAQAVDDAQYDSDSGPCLEAHRLNHVVAVPEIAKASKWPEFRDAALENGFHSSLSLPLAVAEQRIGALNIYSRKDRHLTGTVEQAAVTFAREASVAVANLIAVRRLQDLVGQLTEAIESRDLLGQAKGILMCRHRITAAEAFEMLANTSQRRNVKVRDLAQDVVDTGDLDASPSRG